MIESLIFILVCAVADRARGTQSVYSIVYSFVIASAFDFNIYIFLAFFAGESFGWGAPLGAVLEKRSQGYDKEWWQNKYLAARPALSLVARGFMWAILPATAGYFAGVEHALFLLPIITIAFAVSPFIARKFDGHLDKWETNEYIRGALIGTFITLIN